jgi:hypothetical protein
MTRDFIDGERKRTVANLVVECLEKECVRHVFGFPGEETEDLLFALADSAVFFCALPSRARSSIYNRLLVAG